MKLLGTVALTEALAERGLARGQIGTTVETLAEGIFEVEFSDDEGRTYALLELPAAKRMVLRYDLPRTS